MCDHVCNKEPYVYWHHPITPSILFPIPLDAGGHRPWRRAGCGLRTRLLGFQLRLHPDFIDAWLHSAYGIASVLHAVWYFSGTLAVLILRKPGAAVYVNVVGSAVEMLLGNNFAFGFVFISAILQGIFAEIPFAVTRYRVFNLPMAVLSGLCTALEYGFYLLFFRYQGVALLSPRGIVHMISELVGGALIAGVFSWLLFVAVAKTGALDHFASGRAVRA